MIEFYVSDDEKIVVARCSEAHDDFIQEIAKFWIENFGDSKLPPQILRIVKTYLSLIDKARGIASCNNDDTFDFQIGKYLAQKRLVEKISNLRAKCYKEIEHEVYRAYLEIRKRSKGNFLKAQHCKEELELI